MKTLIVATKNKKKLGEIIAILGRPGLRITSLADYPGAPDIVENGTTFIANARKKAETIAKYTGKLTMGEDSGLCVDALGGKPGVRSARFAGSAKDDNANNRKLLRLLASKKDLKERSAHYVCAVAFADASGFIGAVEGKCSGYIGFEPKGTNGFGYDPLFIVTRYRRTFAQLAPGVKHSMSHRFRALTKARSILRKAL